MLNLLQFWGSGLGVRGSGFGVRGSNASIPPLRHVAPLCAVCHFFSQLFYPSLVNFERATRVPWALTYAGCVDYFVRSAALLTLCVRLKRVLARLGGIESIGGAVVAYSIYGRHVPVFSYVTHAC